MSHRRRRCVGVRRRVGKCENVNAVPRRLFVAIDGYECGRGRVLVTTLERQGTKPWACGVLLNNQVVNVLSLCVLNDGKVRVKRQEKVSSTSVEIAPRPR